MYAKTVLTFLRSPIRCGVEGDIVDGDSATHLTH